LRGFDSLHIVADFPFLFDFDLYFLHNLFFGLLPVMLLVLNLLLLVVGLLRFFFNNLDGLLLLYNDLLDFFGGLFFGGTIREGGEIMSKVFSVQVLVAVLS